jgi:hypothetical protein
VGLRDLAAVLTGTGAQQPTGARSLVWPWPQDMMRYNGRSYLLSNQSYGPNEDARLTGERKALTSNGVVYGIFRARADLFSQARFVWKRYGAGPKPMAADVTTNTALRPLDNPASILEWCEIDVATAGNSYWVLDGAVLRRLPPSGCRSFSARPRGRRPAVGVGRPPGRRDLQAARPARRPRPKRFCGPRSRTTAPERDPDARFRGMSWLRPAMEDVVSDNGAPVPHQVLGEPRHSPSVITFDPTRTSKRSESSRRNCSSRSIRAWTGRSAPRSWVAAPTSRSSARASRTRRREHPQAGALRHRPGRRDAADGGRVDGGELLEHQGRQPVDLGPKAALPVDEGRGGVPSDRSRPQGFELWYDVTGVAALQADALMRPRCRRSRRRRCARWWTAGLCLRSVMAAVTSGDMTKLVHSGNLSVQLLPAGQAPGSGDQGETRNP